MADCLHIRCEPYRGCQFTAPDSPARSPVGDIDTTNSQMVGRDGNGRVCIVLPNLAMTRAEALRHAAWLVVIADDNDEFPGILAAIRNT